MEVHIKEKKTSTGGTFADTRPVSKITVLYFIETDKKRNRQKEKQTERETDRDIDRERERRDGQTEISVEQHTSAVSKIKVFY
jgi:hypothetical protein